MKKTICIILSAIFISAFFVIGAFADDVSITGTTYQSTSTSLITSYSQITALNTVDLPITTNGGTFYYTVFNIPANYESISDVSFSININSLAGRYCLFADDQSGDTLVNLGQLSDNYSDGVNTLTADFSNVTGKVSKVVFVWTKANGATVNFVDCVADIELPNVWDGIGDFISGIFGAIGAFVTGILADELILSFVVLIPLVALAVGLIYKFLIKGRR